MKHKKIIYLAFLGLLITLCFPISAQTPIPFVVQNNSTFSDASIYVAVVGEDLTGPPGAHIFVDCKTGAQKPMDRSYNTVPGPVYGGNKGPGGNGLYANCFTKLSEIPNKTVMLPPIQGCRVFIAQGEQLYFYFFGATGAPSGYTSPSSTDPTDPNQGILFEMIELTYNQYGFFGNTTRVDSYKYPMGMELFGGNGYFKRVGEKMTHAQIGAAWQAYAPTEFKKCYHPTTGEILAPSKTPEFADGSVGTMPTPGPYVNYLKPYIDKIWTKYSSEDLIFDSGDAGIWKGRVQGEQLSLTCIAGGFLGRKGIISRRPTTQEALEGKGVLDRVVQDKTTDLLVQAQICAAINRHVINISTPNVGQQNWSVASTYYTAAPTNYYAKFWHRADVSIDQLSYGFAYDDVWDYSSSLHSPTPTKVVAVFGGYAGKDLNTPPSVSITSPINNAAFTAPASITITANASDANGTVSKVEFYRGTTLIGTDYTAPYSISWSNPAAGSYSLTAKATDNQGAATTSAVVNIKVSTTNQLPTVSITSPANNASFTAGSNVVINASAADADGSIVKVDFYRGTTLIGTDNTAPYSITWSNAAEGTYSLTARATDNQGGVKTSGAVGITVTKTIQEGCSGTATNGDYSYQVSTTSGITKWTFIPLSPISGSNMAIIYINGAGYMMSAAGANFTYSKAYTAGQSLTFFFTYRVGTTGSERNSSANPHTYVAGKCTGENSINIPPVVSITSPTGGASFAAPASISIAANASDSDGTITKVEFFNGSTKLGEDLTSPYTLSWSNVAQGTYSITAKATDNGGAVSTSTAVSITVGSTGGGCTGTASNGDYSYQVSTTSGVVKFTFIPLAPIAGSTMSIIYVNGIGYSMTASGSNFTFSRSYTAGQTLSFFFTYRVGNTGTERNSSANPHTYVVGNSCTATRVIDNEMSLSEIGIVYPNPVQNILHLKNISEGSQIFIRSLNSNLIVKPRISNNSIDISDLQKGIYLLEIKDGDRIINKRIIKN